MHVKSKIILIGLLLAAILAVSANSAGGAQVVQKLDEFAYLPLITKPGGCPLAGYEAQIAERMRTHPQQQRPSLVCDPILARVAHERAQDTPFPTPQRGVGGVPGMARRKYFDHVNPDGYGPNCLVRMAGYPLPSWYAPCPGGNNIESIAAGQSTPGAVWQAWMDSAGHRTHLLGLHPFYAAQIDYGVGYAYDPDSRYGHYWVVITAKRE